MTTHENDDEESEDWSDDPPVVAGRGLMSLFSVPDLQDVIHNMVAVKPDGHVSDLVGAINYYRTFDGFSTNRAHLDHRVPRPIWIRS